MKSKNRMIQELIGLAMKVHYETDYCVFVRFSGHVDNIVIEIRESKKSWQEEIVSGEFYTSKNWEKRMYQRYENIRSVLLEILETGEFDPESEHIHQQRHISYANHM